MNLLFYGYHPVKLLSEYIHDAGDCPIPADFLPEISIRPIAVENGTMVHCMLAEVKADWKFIKDC